MQEKKGFSGSTLKIIAMISMLVDHSAYILLGAMLMSNGIFHVGDYSAEYIAELIETGSVGWIYLAYQIMRRVIGRIAFPIFCFLLVEGFEKTRSRSRYAIRLFLFALISEVPFDMAFSYGTVNWLYQNVFFTLFIGFLTMWGMEKAEAHCENVWAQWSYKVLLVLGACLLAEKAYCDYGAYGILAISLLYLFRHRKSEQMIAGCVAFLWELPALLGFIPIAFYNGKRGLKLKYIFYAFYPVHLIILHLIFKLCF